MNNCLIIEHIRWNSYESLSGYTRDEIRHIAWRAEQCDARINIVPPKMNKFAQFIDYMNKDIEKHFDCDFTDEDLNYIKSISKRFIEK